MPPENRSSNNEQMNNISRPSRELWDMLNALPRYMFLLRPSGSSIQKLEDSTGNWIDVHEAQAIIDTAQEQINELGTLLEQPTSDGFSAGDMADQGAKAFREGVKSSADLIQKRMDDYLSEFGVMDPETGSVELPRGGDEYVGELQEIIEAVRALPLPQ